jgi:hypothetical protein
MEQPEDEREALWLSLRSQMSLHEIYQIRIDEQNGIALTKEEIDFILYKCAVEGHPMAQLEIAENIFFKKKSFSLDVKFEKKVNQDCHGNVISTELKMKPTQVTDLALPIASHEYIVAKEFVKLALRTLLENEEYKIYLPGMCGAGLGGLYPYEPFAAKESLEKKECQDIFLFWKTKYKESKELSKEEDGAKRTFLVQYASTEEWLQCLCQNWEDTEFFFLVHKMLHKLNMLEMPAHQADSESSEEAALPWWKDSGWK